MTLYAQAFAPASPDRSAQGVGIVEAKPLPARHTVTPDPEAAPQARPDAEHSAQSVGIIDAKPLPARRSTPQVPGAAAQAPAERSGQGVEIVDAKPLPARHNTEPNSEAATSELPQQSRETVGIMEAKPLPARHTASPVPAEVRPRSSKSIETALPHCVSNVLMLMHCRSLVNQTHLPTDSPIQQSFN